MGPATISSKGQIAIPKEIRDALHIKAGDKFTVEIIDGTIVLRPVVTLTIPKDQAWFWTSEIQKVVKKAEENFQKGSYRTYKLEELTGELEVRK
jgi:antitoxin MazE